MIEISFDDGTPEDLQVIELLDKYELLAIFYLPINSWGFENLKKYSGYEIGCHTFTHPMDMKKLDDAQLDLEVQGAKDKLDQAGRPGDKFCFPRGRYNPHVIHKIKEAGFKEARTTAVLKNKDDDEFLKHTAVHFYNRIEYGDRDWYDVAVDMLEKKFEVLRFWGHSAEIDKFNDWEKLEEFFQYLDENRSTLGV